MQALILVAGMGRRLNETRPKGLVPVRGVPLLDRQLTVLHACGVEQICLVTGYQHELIESRYAGRADFRFNPFHATTNNMVSFLMARDWCRGELLVLYADLLFHPSLIRTAIKSRAELGMVVDRGRAASGHGLASIKNERVVGFTTQLSTAPEAARFVGISRFTESGLQRTFAAVENAARAGRLQDYYIVGLQALWEAGGHVAAIDVTGQSWMEVDTQADLIQAEQDWSD
jgi:choline kinase